MINIGKIKDRIYSGLINENTDVEFKNFFNILSKDQNLMYEFYVYNNIKSYKTSDIEDAKMYIDTNLALIGGILKEDRIESLTKLKKYNKSGRTSAINESIEKLIGISIDGINPMNLNTYQSNMKFVCEHILKNDKQVTKINEEEKVDLDGFTFEMVLNKVTEKLNEKYGDDLNEQECEMIKGILSFDESKEKVIFENYKKEIIGYLNSDEDINQIPDLAEAITKINEMVYNPETFMDDLIDLSELI